MDRHAPADGIERISYYSSIKHGPPVDVEGLEGVYRTVAGDMYREQITRLRALLASGDKAAYRKLKEDLPAWTFAARFEGPHSKSETMEPSGLACLDYDDLADAEGVMIQASNHPNVVMAFRSPSNEGVKVIVRLAPIPELWVRHNADGKAVAKLLDYHYQTAFRFASRYFANLWRITPSEDAKTRDMTRLTFVSWDPDAYYNPNAREFYWGHLKGLPPEQAAELAAGVSGHYSLMSKLVYATKSRGRWDDALRNQIVDLYEFACGRQCTPGKDYAGGVDRAASAADEDNVGEDRQRVKEEDECLFNHDTPDYAERVADALANDLRFIDGGFRHTLGSPVWLESEYRHIVAKIANAGGCYSQCVKRRSAQILLEIERRGRDAKLSRSATFWIDGKVWVCGKGIGRWRLREATYSDNLRFEPSRIPLPNPNSDEWHSRAGKENEPALVEEIFRHSLGMHPKDIEWVRRFLSRALDGPQRTGTFILGYSSTGKTTTQETLAEILPRATQTISGEVLDKYAIERIMFGIFVFMDEAQDIDRAGWSVAKNITGGQHGMVRGMGRSDDSRASESSLMVFGEAPGMQFNRNFGKGEGWDNRLAYIIPDKPGDDHTDDPRIRERLLEPGNVAHFMMWIIDGDNEFSKDNVKRTPYMAEAAAEVHAAAGCADDCRTVRNSDGSATNHATESTYQRMLAFTREVVDEYQDLEAKPNYDALAAKLNERGFRNSRGGRYTARTAKTLASEANLSV